MALAYQNDVPWGWALKGLVATQPGGLKRLVDCIHGEIGSVIGARTTFMRLFFSGGPEMLNTEDQQRAWFLTSAAGKKPADWGIDDAVLPKAWYGIRRELAKRIRDAVLTVGYHVAQRVRAPHAAIAPRRVAG